jgi:hypothetical protein
LALAVGLAACAGSDGTLGPDRIRVTGLEVADDPKVDVRYPALLTFEADGDVRIIDSCFTWADTGSRLSWLSDGPYCFASEKSPANAVRSMLLTGYAGTYQVEGYVRYASGGVLRRSNSASSEVTVTRRH